MQQAEEDYQADVSRQVAQARYAAEHAEQAEEAIRAEQDANVESGEVDELERKPVSKKLFVKRYGRFISAASVELVPGENLYRHRKRSMGVSEKYIKHSVVLKRRK